MLSLKIQDLTVLDRLAQGITEDDVEKEGVLAKLVIGFGKYASEEMVGPYASHEDFFIDKIDRLLSNIDDAQKNLDDLLKDKRFINYMNLVAFKSGVKSCDTSDVVQEVLRKFFESKWIERYNPLMSSFCYFILKPLKNYSKTYISRHYSRKTSSLSQEIHSGSKTYLSLGERIYQPDQNIPPDRKMMVSELIEEWEDFLSVQASFKPTVFNGFKKLATLLPPGIKEIPTDSELEVGFIKEGKANSGVTTLELYEKGIFCKASNHLLMDYISVNPLTGENLVDQSTGEFLTQKFYLNSDYDKQSDIFKKLCVLIPPGTDEIPTSSEKILYFLSEGRHKSRVALPDLYSQGVEVYVPNELLVSYIAIDEYTREELKDKYSGKTLTHKFYFNPDYLDNQKMVRIERKILDFYKYLREGYQLEEIAHIFRVPVASMSAWMRRIESLFQSFWLISNKIPSHLKLLAIKTYKCPRCHKLHKKMRLSCDSCGSNLSEEKCKIRLDSYPWPNIYGTRETMERLELSQRPHIKIPICSF